MQKYLSIPVTATGETSQLIAVKGILIISQATTTTVTINYDSATTADVITLTHTAMPADDVSVRDRIQDSVVSVLATAWQHPSLDVSLSGLVSAATGAVSITGIALS